MFAAQGTAVHWGFSLLVPGQHKISDLECPLLGLMGVRAKPLGDHFIWRTTWCTSLHFESPCIQQPCLIFAHSLICSQGWSTGLTFSTTIWKTSVLSSISDAFCSVAWLYCLGVMFAKDRALLLKGILHNTPKNPSRQGKECSSGVTSQSHLNHDWSKCCAELKEYTISAAFGTFFHWRKWKSILPTCIFWVELTPNHGTSRDNSYFHWTHWDCLYFCLMPLWSCLRNHWPGKHIAPRNLHSSQHPSQLPSPKDTAIEIDVLLTGIVFDDSLCLLIYENLFSFNH